MQYPCIVQNKIFAPLPPPPPPPPFPFSKKNGGTLFSAFRGAWRVVRGSEFLVGTLSPWLLPQFLSNPFEI